jgi:uncharacterized protein YndB with AHSA1/START domain
MRIEQSLEIKAPADIVWSVTTDVERWPEWTPTMLSVQRLEAGAFQIGSSARVKQPQLAKAIWRVTSLTPGKQFTWETQNRGMRMVATHEVVPIAGGCTSHLCLEISGWLALLLGPLIRRSAARAMTIENKGLRDLCEQRARRAEPTG